MKILKENDVHPEINDVEIAIIDAIKDLIQILLHHKLASPDSLTRAFTSQFKDYEEQGLTNAMRVMDELRSYVIGTPRASERDIIRKLLEQPPEK